MDNQYIIISTIAIPILYISIKYSHIKRKIISDYIRNTTKEECVVCNTNDEFVQNV